MIGGKFGSKITILLTTKELKRLGFKILMTVVKIEEILWNKFFKLAP
jgi:hypothetical protein